MQIRKKTWPDMYELLEKGKKQADVRLADFDVDIGDTMVFEEYDPETEQYSGRKIEKIVKGLTKVKPLQYYPTKDIKKYGFYVLELD